MIINNWEDANIIKHSDSYVEGKEVCCSYLKGKCIEEQGKYCDGCSKYGLERRITI